jgi:hypothetical protein
MTTVWIILGIIVLLGVTSPAWGPSALLWGPRRENEDDYVDYTEYR